MSVSIVAPQPTSWAPGTYHPEALHQRIVDLLEMVCERAKADREAGRFKAAEDGEELARCVTEYIRGCSETFLAMQRTILVQAYRDGPVS